MKLFIGRTERGSLKVTDENLHTLFWIPNTNEFSEVKSGEYIEVELVRKE